MEISIWQSSRTAGYLGTLNPFLLDEYLLDRCTFPEKLRALHHLRKCRGMLAAKVNLRRKIGSTEWDRKMDLKLLRLYQITKFLSEFPGERFESKEADLAKLFFIPLILAAQPSQDWIEKINKPDQADYWAAFSRQFYWISKCWVSSNTFQDDPLRPLLNEGRISRNEYNIMWFSQKMFERLWEVCQHTAPFVRKSFEQAKVEYPFADAVSLFAQIVEEMVDSQFSLCLESYVHFSRTKREKALRLQVRAYAGERLTKTQEQIIQTQRKKTPLGDLLIRIARKAAKEEAVIKAALEDYEVACGRLLKAYATEWHNKGCHAWIHGHIVKGSESTIYPLPRS